MPFSPWQSCGAEVDALPMAVIRGEVETYNGTPSM
jgi:hypothetical protein